MMADHGAGKQADSYDVGFTADDHRFHDEYLTEEKADDDAAELLGLLELTPGQRLLDAGCGDGRLAVRLAAIGLRVVGVDLDADQLGRAAALAAARGVSVTWHQGDLRDLDDPGAFDGAALWFNTFGFADDETNDAVLAGLARTLRPGGALVIDTLWREGVRAAVLDEVGPVEVVRGDAVQSDRSSFDERAGRLVTVRTIVTPMKRIERTLRLRLPTLAEWKTMCARHELDLESATGRAGAPLDDGSLELVLVARRR